MSSQEISLNDTENAHTEQPMQQEKQSSARQNSEINSQIENQAITRSSYTAGYSQHDYPLYTDMILQVLAPSQQGVQPLLNFTSSINELGIIQHDAQPSSQQQPPSNVASGIPEQIISHLFDDDSNTRAYELEHRIDREFSCYSFLLFISLV